MKKLATLAIALTLLISCRKEEHTSTIDIQEYEHSIFVENYSNEACNVSHTLFNASVGVNKDTVIYFMSTYDEANNLKMNYKKQSEQSFRTIKLKTNIKTKQARVIILDSGAKQY